MPDFAGVNTDYTYIAIPYDKYAWWRVEKGNMKLKT
jgi:hypothetical protein